MKFTPPSQLPPEDINNSEGLGVRRGGVQFLLYFILNFFIPYAVFVTALHLLPFDIIPDFVEKKIGAWMMNLLEEEPDKDNLEMQNLLQKIKPADPRMPLHVFVSSKGGINAMAYPGGQIVFLKDLFDLLKNEEEKAAILAHEIGHSELNHYARRLSTAIALIPFNWVLSFAGVGQFDVAQRYLFLAFSRKDEQDCDDYAAEILWKYYGSLDGAINGFAHLKSADSERFGKIMKYSSTHPLTPERIERFRKLQKEWTEIQKPTKASSL